MKNLIGLFILFMSGAVILPTQACDETCRKRSAAAQHGVEFSGYLSRRYCSDIAVEFMTTSMKSLQNYRDRHLQSKHRGGMRNTSQFISQRREWLDECDQYLSMTDYGRIFKDDKTTDNIMGALKSVSRELDSLVKGVTYANDLEENSTAVAAEKFDRLFELVAQHKTLLQLKGQLVIR